jgi:hypothetical protein
MAVKPHTELVTLICLATGTRWSGAEQLTLHRLQDNVVAYSGSKSGKVRHVLVQAELASFGPTGRPAGLLLLTQRPSTA